MGVLSLVTFAAESSRTRYKSGTEWTAFGGQTKLTDWHGSEEIQLRKMSRYGSRTVMGCGSHQYASSVLSGTENTFHGLIIKS